MAFNLPRLSLGGNFNFTVMDSVYVMTSFVFTPRVLAR